MSRKFAHPILFGVAIYLWLTLACALVVPAATATPIPTATAIPATATPQPTSTPLPNYDGKWTGLTSQGESISFEVVGNGVTKFSVKASLEGGGCSSTVEMTSSFSTPYPIQNHVLKVDSDSSQSSYVLHATFASDQAVSGTFEYTAKQNCSGSVLVDWSANKQTP